MTNDNKSQTSRTKSRGPIEELRTMTKDFVMSEKCCSDLMVLLNTEIEKGLHRATHKSADVKCFPTYVQNLPTGNSSGFVLALDLGGTNFRVMGVTFRGVKDPHILHSVYAVPPALMTGTGTALFDHIAACIWTFLREYGVAIPVLKLGFTFSFPLDQRGLGKAVLVRWTKGFSCSGVVGNDVVELLQAALKRTKGSSMSEIVIVAVINDTTATLVCCARKFHCCRIGVINGTGTNACYVERLEKVQTFLHDEKTASKPNVVLVNTEWGAFGDNGVLEKYRTKFDRIVDKNSINATKQLFEKMASGMYLGEMVRLILLEATEAKILFQGHVTKELQTRNVMNAKFLSECERDVGENSALTRKALSAYLGVNGANDADCHAVRLVCERVSTRSAHLIAAALSVLVKRTCTFLSMPKIAIGADGSVFQKHPHFTLRCLKMMRVLLSDSGFEWTIEASTDGSGVGAATVAATHD